MKLSAPVPIFFFCVPGPVFAGTEGVGSPFHVLRPRTLFRRYRGRRVPFSYFALPDSFSAVSRALGPFFTFCAPGHVFGGTEGVTSLFHVLRSWTHFRQCRGRRVPFSCFALPNSFLAALSALGFVFMFWSPELVFGRIEGVWSHFQVLRSRTRFRRFRGRLVPFSCFALLDSVSGVPRASSSIFMFWAPGLVFGGFEGVRSLFHVLLSRTHFQR
jgi:hypothetical protein